VRSVVSSAPATEGRPWWRLGSGLVRALSQAPTKPTRGKMSIQHYSRAAPQLRWLARGVPANSAERGGPPPARIDRARALHLERIVFRGRALRSAARRSASILGRCRSERQGAAMHRFAPSRIRSCSIVVSDELRAEPEGPMQGRQDKSARHERALCVGGIWRFRPPRRSATCRPLQQVRFGATVLTVPSCTPRRVDHEPS
jgi:hypothetical protein